MRLFTVTANVGRMVVEHEFSAADEVAARGKMHRYLLKRRHILQSQCVYAENFDVVAKPFVVFWQHGITTVLGGIKAKMKTFDSLRLAKEFRYKLQQMQDDETLYQQGYVMTVGSNF